MLRISPQRGLASCLRRHALLRERAVGQLRAVSVSTHAYAFNPSVCGSAAAPRRRVAEHVPLGSRITADRTFAASSSREQRRPARLYASQAPAADSASAASAASRNVVDVLKERGLLDAVTNEAGLKAAAAEGALKVYCGFDPTADSLHLGNLLGIIVLAWFQRCGHVPVALVGGATGSVGDPSGKSSERPVLEESVLQANAEGIRKVLSTLLTNSNGQGSDPLVMNNIDWFGGMGLLTFLRTVGKYARVGVMLSKDSVKSRMGGGEDGEGAEGMSYTEFTYQLLQAYDFSYLFEKHGVAVQIGGSDQWGNITAGTDLIRRVQQRDGAFGLTFPLLLRSDGRKFGKSEEGAIWLTSDKLSPYKFYQYMFATPDSDVPRFMRMLTFMEMDEIEGFERALKDPAGTPGYETNAAQRRLAEELTRFVHGEAGLEQARRATEGLKPGSATTLDAAALEALAGDVPSVTLAREEVVGMLVCDVMAAAALQPSKSAARRLIQGGGVYLNNQKVESDKATVQAADALDGRVLLLAAGKKNKMLVRISG